MEQEKGMVYGLIIIAGLILSWLAYVEQDTGQPHIMQKGATLLVDGKVPPSLSGIPFHMSYIDEDTCLKCHSRGRTIELMNQNYVAPKMAHEFRKDCTSCHKIPSS
ncbi:MAG: hypothetical protein GXO92_05885 [FCB group bacterium]|nr:hypothetical protein [FCB group bacterium]